MMAQIARVLVVDDDSESRTAIELILKAGNFEHVAHARSAEEGFQLLDIENDGDSALPNFDLILLDIMMPAVDGIEACARIRNTRRYRDIPLLIVSGLRDVESLNQAFLAGAHDYITKPLNRLELLARVRSAMRLKRELDRRRARETELRDMNRELQFKAASHYYDDNARLLSRAAFEFMVQKAADSGQPFGILGLLIDDIAHYRSMMGADATNSLIARVAAAVGKVEAPLNWAFCSYGEGLFMVLADGATGEALAMVGEQARACVEMLGIPHGNSAAQDYVRISAAARRARGVDVLGLPSAVIRGLAALSEAGGDRFRELEAER